MSFKLEDYEPVEDRIKRFHADNEKGRIITEMVSDYDKIETVVFKAYIYIDETEIPVSTGYAYEKDGVGYVNKTSHIENCETSAIGRALANYKYSGSKRPSREEMEKVKRHENNNDLVSNAKAYGKELAEIADADTLTRYRELYKAGNYKECIAMYESIIKAV